MKKFCKRALAVLLAVMLLVSVAPMAVFAEKQYDLLLVYPDIQAKRDAGTAPYGTGNTIDYSEQTLLSDGNYQCVYLAQNEMEGFQIFFYEWYDPRELHVTVSDFVNEAGEILPHKVYKEEYFTSTGVEDYPLADPLIPYCGEAVQTAPQENRMFYVELHSGKDQTPGVYTASITVSDENSVLTTRYIKATVWNFALPEGHYGTTIAGLYNSSSGYGGTNGFLKACGVRFDGNEVIPEDVPLAESILEGWQEVLLEHGITTYELPRFLIDQDEKAAQLAMADPRRKAFVVPLLNNDVYNGSFNAATEAKILQYKNLIQGNEYLENKSFFYPVESENPNWKNEEDAAVYNARISAIESLWQDYHAVVPVAGVNDFSLGKLRETTDILCMNQDMLHKSADFRSVFTDGTWNRTWRYQGGIEDGGFYLHRWGKSTMGLFRRILYWQASALNSDGILHWNAAYLPNDENGEPYDVWANMAIPPSAGPSTGNGDGILVYPGTAIGLDATKPVETLRLKQISDGMDDYDYLTLAKEFLGEEQWASFINRVLRFYSTSGIDSIYCSEGTIDWVAWECVTMNSIRILIGNALSEANTEHTYGEWKTVVNSDDNHDGLQIRICADCGAEESRALTSHEHTFGNWTQTTAPTCGAAGKETRTCSGCNVTETREIPATGHTWSAYSGSSGTCTTEGQKTRTCSVCGRTETAVIPMKGHLGDWTETAATCTENGQRTRTCSRCGETETEVIPATGHNFGDWTENGDGQRSRTCQTCGYIETETVAEPTGGSTLADWNYTLDDDDGTVTLTKYIGSADSVTVPGSFESEGQTYITVLVSTSVFRSNTLLRSISIGAGVRFSGNSMRYLFGGCTSLTNVDLSAVDTTGVVSLNYLFYNCSALQAVDLSAFDTGSVTEIYAMFSGCTNLSGLTGYENWNTSSLEIMSFAFNKFVNSVSANVQVTIDLSRWDLSHLRSSAWCFQNCRAQHILLPDNLAIMSAGFLNHAVRYEGTSFTVPAGVKKIGYAHTLYDFATNDLTEIRVAEGNTNYVAIDGVLYSADGKEMLAVPRNKPYENGVFEIPEGVEFLGELSFSRNYNIHTVVLPDTYEIEYVPLYDDRYITYSDTGNLNAGTNLSIAIYCYTGITDYAVKSTNPHYTSADGIIYSKDMKHVVAIPARYNKVMNIPEGVTDWDKEAMWADGSTTVDNLLANCSGVIIPSTLKTISNDQFTMLNRLYINRKNKSNPFTITIAQGNKSFILGENGIEYHETIDTASGVCGAQGDNLTWELDLTTGEMIISGTGAMADYTDFSLTPWYDYKDSIQSITVDSGVTSIGGYAFYRCTGLTDIYYSGTPASWARINIGDYNTSLLSANIHYGVFSGTCGIMGGNSTWVLDLATGELTISGTGAIGGYYSPWRQYASYIKTVTIGNGITVIYEDTFMGMDYSNLTNVNIPNSVTSIADYAFTYCTGLTSITIPDSVTYLGQESFSNCTGLASVTIGSGVTNIGIAAFRNCTALESVNIPNSLTSIGNYAFEYCTGLEYVHIPSTVTNIGDDVFSGTNSSFYICSDTADCAAATYAQANNIEFCFCGDPVCELRADGKYYIDGVAVPAYYGLIKYEGDYYYIKDNARIVQGKTVYVSTTNGLTFPNGDPIQKGNYEFDADGKMIIKQGVQADGKYYINGLAVPAYYGLVEWEGDFYYIKDNAQIVRSRTCYINTTHDLTLPNGNPIQNKYYEFDADGKMIIKQGIQSDGKYYIDGVAVPSYYGLVLWEGDFYYIKDNAQIVRSKTCQVNTTNDLTFPNGEAIKQGGYYEFDADGKMIIKQGIQSDGKYYINGLAVGSYYGLVLWEGDFYYIKDNAQIVRSKTCQVNTLNGLTFPNGDPIKQGGYYEFDADGKMIIKQGVQADGKYYINGVAVPSYYGLVEDGGYYYYIKDNAQIVRSKTIRVNTTNGLTFPDGTPIPKGDYIFDADGRMVY